MTDDLRRFTALLAVPRADLDAACRSELGLNLSGLPRAEHVLWSLSRANQAAIFSFLNLND